MGDIQTFICKTCGGDIDLSLAVNGTVKCAYCQNVYTLPKKETSPAALSFIRQGEHDLDTGRFGDAYTAFKKAAELDENEPEAYWGMALAEFKVQFLKDAAKKRLQPICSEITQDYFTDSKNYLKALSLATEEQKSAYKAMGEEIDYIRDEFYKLKSSGVDYDCFICVKVTDDETGEKTADYKTADWIYNLLQNKGYTPFFSERVILNKTGADYEAMILYALYTSETMLVVCSNKEYLQTSWVKNEYQRFLKLVKDEEKENDSITVIFNGTPIEQLEGKNGKIQGIDFRRRDSDSKILKFVDEHTPQFKAKKEEEKRKKEEEEKAIRLQIEAQQKAQRELEEKLNNLNFDDKNEELRRQIEEQKEAQRIFEEKLKNLNFSGGYQSASADGSTVGTLLIRANQEIEVGNWEKAKNFCEEILKRSPENAEAWWKLFLIDFKAENQDKIIKNLNYDNLRAIENNRNFNCAMRYSSGSLKENIENFKNELYSGKRWWDLFLQEMEVGEESELYDEPYRTLNKINVSKNFKLAQKYASGEIKVRIDNLMNELHSGNNWWKQFLKSFNVSDESEILEKMSYRLYKEIQNDFYYNEAKKYADENLKLRINKFIKEFQSSERLWNLFLEDMNVSDEEFIVSHLSVQVLNKIINNENFEGAIQFANGKMRERISLFFKRIDNKISDSDAQKDVSELKEKANQYTIEIQKLTKQIEEYTKLTEKEVKKDSFFGNFVIFIIPCLIFIGMSSGFVWGVLMGGRPEFTTVLFIDAAIVFCLFIIINMLMVRSNNKKVLEYENNLIQLKRCKERLPQAQEEYRQLEIEIDNKNRHLDTIIDSFKIMKNRYFIFF